MADDRDEFSSPACALNETDDLYRGFLPPAVIQAHIRRWIAASPAPEIAIALAALLIGNTPTANAPLPNDKSPEPIPSAQLRDEMIAVLPKIRDDRMHEMLNSVVLRL
jgi:hypothetical protein